jgi:hypothetical protein
MSNESSGLRTAYILAAGRPPPKSTRSRVVYRLNLSRHWRRYPLQYL